MEREIKRKILKIFSVVAAMNAGIVRMFTELLWYCNILPSEEIFV